MRTDTRVLSLRLEDGILITGCDEVWRTKTRPVKLNTTLASGRRYSEERQAHTRLEDATLRNGSVHNHKDDSRIVPIC
ncbi:MAG: hypothetical protein K6G31_07585 [Paludibacteraceae bacterium]|nr:hypothetical protein [Paludibacteraceae bacterium]